MTATLFVDTNVFLYTVDELDPAKQQRATWLLAELAERAHCVISTQVLQEFYATVTRRLNRLMTASVAEAAVHQLARLDVRSIDARTVLGAVARAGSRQWSLWDALIVQSAVESGCSVLLTEDLTHGEVIDGVRIVDPFQGDEDEVLALFR